MKKWLETEDLNNTEAKRGVTGKGAESHLSGGSPSPEGPAVLAEGWKEANIRMGLLGLGREKSQDLKQNRTVSPRKGQSLNTTPEVPPTPGYWGADSGFRSLSGTKSR